VSGVGYIAAAAMVILGSLSLLEVARSLSDGVAEADWGTIVRAEKPLAFRLTIGFETVLGLLFFLGALFSR
jgi:hypothetical protein